MIDVGQGESCLIIASNIVLGAVVQRRTMLIDGGTSVYGRHINDYIANLGIAAVDHIVISHYDADHSGGILTLLSADNLYRTCETIADAAVAAVGAAAGRGADNPHQTAAAMSGGYDLNGVNLFGQVAVNAGVLAEALHLPIDNTSRQDADAGSGAGYTALTNAGPNLNPGIFNLGMALRRKAWIKAANDAANTVGTVAAMTAATITALFNVIRSGVRPDARFLTNGRFRNTNIIDTGDTAGLPNGYVNIAMNGQVLNNNIGIDAPNLGRMRTSVAQGNLGDEMLWNTGPAAVAAPAGSPAAFLVACNKYMWPAAGPIAGGLNNNDDSIGLVLRFNRFFYYTAGDLPSAGDQLVATGVMNNGFANPQGGPNFALPARIAAFKCGHHGSNNSTSQSYLNTALPRGALISCGTNPFGHPEQNLVNRLHGDVNIQFFYMTNCQLLTIHVPASDAQNQLTAVGNKSRIAGDNNANNLVAHRDKGDIILRIDTAASNSALAVNRRYQVTYYDEDQPVPIGPPSATGADRTENTQF